MLIKIPECLFYQQTKKPSVLSHLHISVKTAREMKSSWRQTMKHNPAL